MKGMVVWIAVSVVLLFIIITLLLVAIDAAKADTGGASWYGPGLYGNRMACGGRLTTSTWGVAHRYLPCGTRLTVCYRGCVRVTVIDRGPYVYGRTFDLTYPVKRAIGFPDVGSVRWYLHSQHAGGPLAEVT